MEAKDSKQTCITYEDAIKRVTEAELIRMKEAFERLSNLNGLISKQTFLKDVLGDIVPKPVAEYMYNACGGTSNGIALKELLCGLLFITRGSEDEKIKFLFELYSNKSCTHVVRETGSETLQRACGSGYEPDSIGAVPNEVNEKANNLDEKFKKLSEIATCAICLDILRCDFVQCVNGHFICQVCKRNLTTCPTCYREFSETKCPFLTQVLEILPIHCKFVGCSELFDKDDIHEKYCGFRITDCKLCEWLGPVNDILNHLEHAHLNSMPTQTGITVKLSAMYTNSFTLTQTNYNQFFWLEAVYSSTCKEKAFTVTWTPVPNGKPDRNYKATVSFKSSYTTEVQVKLNCNPDVDLMVKNNVSLPFEIIRKFIDSKGNIKFRISKLNFSEI